MKKLEQLKTDYQRIIHRNIPNKVKKLILEAILHELNQLQKMTSHTHMELQINSCIKTEKTNSTLAPSMFSNIAMSEQGSLSEITLLSCNLSKDDLQAKIIQKQRKKYCLNEEIQILQEEYFQRQKILMTKKDFCEQLDDQITRKSYEISKKSCQQSHKLMVVEQQRQSLSARLKYFFLG